MNLDTLINEVAQDVSAALARQTTLIDAGANQPEGRMRAAVVIAVLRAYASVIEESEVPVDQRHLVQQLTENTTKALFGALKTANKKG
jgi:hypothetical protein